MRTQLAPLLGLLVLPACVSTEPADPSEGGFFEGLSGITSGSYDALVVEEENAVATAEARNAALTLEESALRAEIRASARALTAEKARLRQLSSSGLALDAPTAARVEEVLAREPAGGTSAQQLADLQKAVADARALSDELSRL